MEDHQTKSLSGIPGLAQIPILQVPLRPDQPGPSENEIVFAHRPHIIRGTDVNEFNQRPIDIGTANTIAVAPCSTRKPLPPASGAPRGPDKLVPPSRRPARRIQPRSRRTPNAPATAPDSSQLPV